MFLTIGVRRLGARTAPLFGSFGIRSTKGMGLPARNLVMSMAPVWVRGLWHSPQPTTPLTRYSPRAITRTLGGLPSRRRAAVEAELEGIGACLAAVEAAADWFAAGLGLAALAAALDRLERRLGGRRRARGRIAPGFAERVGPLAAEL